MKRLLSGVSVLLCLVVLLGSGCGDTEDTLLDGVTLNSITVQPASANVGGGFSIPFNEAFSFVTARASDTKTVQLSITGSLSDGSQIALPIDSSTVSFSPLGEVARVTPQGLLYVDSIETCGDSLEVVVSYHLAGVVKESRVLINTACFVATAGSGGARAEPFIPAGGAYTTGFVGQARGPDRVDRILTGDELRYSFKEPIPGVKIEPLTGRIDVESSVAAGRRIVVVVSYLEPLTGLSLNSEVEFEVK